MEHFKRDMYEKKVEETKLVGAQIPTDVSSYLNLFCVVDSRSKTSIIRPLVEKWAKKAKKTFPENDLIKLAADMGYNSWKHRRNRKTTFAQVMKIQRRELEKKGVSDSDIDKIIKRIEDVKSKES